MSLVGGRAPELDPVDPGLPDHLRAVNTGHWTDLIWRLKVSRNIKATAMVLAFHADEDGSNVFPGNWRVADMLNVDESNSTPDIKRLEELGMLYLVKRGGGRWAPGADEDAADADEKRPSNEYRLTRPADITTLPLWLDPTMRRYEPRPKRKRKSKANPPVIPSESQADSPVVNGAGSPPPALAAAPVRQADSPVIAPADRPAPLADRPEWRANPPVTPAESQAAAPVIHPEWQADSPATHGEWQADSPGINGIGPVDNSARPGMTGGPDRNDRRSEAEWQVNSPPDLYIPPLHPTTRVVTLGDHLTWPGPDRDPAAGSGPAVPRTATVPGGPTGPDRAPSVGAAFIDGTDAGWIAEDRATAELDAAQRLIAAIDDREQWLSAGRDFLEARGHRVTVGSLAMTTAEFYRRALAAGLIPDNPKVT